MPSHRPYDAQMNSELVTLLEQNLAEIDGKLLGYEALKQQREATVFLIEVEKSKDNGTSAVRVRKRPSSISLLSRNESTHGSTSRAVKSAVWAQQGAFTVKDIAAYLNIAGTPLTNLQISSVLSRLKKFHIIRIFHEGQGSEPNQYKRNEAVAA